MKKTGIVICNFNKCEYVLNCIQSVLESNTDDFDIFVVDNASSDNSVEAINKKYGSKVTVLVNKENLGGSGGFNTGIRKVLELGYEYLYCLDNDVLVDENAISALVTYLDEHKDTGMAGSIVYHMDFPAYVQQYGLQLDFDNYTAITNYADFLDDGTIPDVMHCDCVATCSVMIRTKCIKESNIGIMPENNFIYWDDMEWSYRFNLAGYDVVTIKESVVLHKMGSNTKPANTFINYYMWRNRINFFMRYTKEEQLEQMSVRILSSVFDSLYESMYREEHNVMRSISYAYYDAVKGVRGKAADYKIMKNDANDNKIRNYLSSKESYYLCECENAQLNEQIDSFLQIVHPDIKKAAEKEGADCIICPCNYVMRVSDAEPDIIYIDSENNCIIDNEDREAVKQYEYSKALFIYMNQSGFLDTVSSFQNEN